MTRFELLTTQILPWAEKMFPTAPGRNGPIVGLHTNRQKGRLEVRCPPIRGPLLSALCGRAPSGPQVHALLRARMPQRAVTADIGTPDKLRRYGSRQGPRAFPPERLLASHRRAS